MLVQPVDETMDLSQLMGGDPSALLDSPMFSQIAFHPRPAQKGSSVHAGAIDGEYAGAGGVQIGYRLYPLAGCKTLIVHFHGNAELAAEMDHGVGLYRESESGGCAVLAVDFRGYGWSTGQPRLTTLCADADALVDALPAILAQAGGDAAATRCALVGRSIGGVCAVHLASRHPTRFPSLLIESSLCRIFELPMVANIAAMMGPQGAVLLQALPDPFDQLGKLRAAPTVRCTVLHGDRDELIPLAQGKSLFGASAAPPSRKRLVVLKGAGHNDMGMHATYRELVAAFLAAHAADADADADGDEVPIGSWSVKELRTRLDQMGVDRSGCVEKSDLSELLARAIADPLAKM